MQIKISSNFCQKLPSQKKKKLNLNKNLEIKKIKNKKIIGLEVLLWLRKTKKILELLTILLDNFRIKKSRKFNSKAKIKNKIFPNKT